MYFQCIFDKIDQVWVSPVSKWRLRSTWTLIFLVMLWVAVGLMDYDHQEPLHCHGDPSQRHVPERENQFLMKNVKMGDFVSVISPWKRRLKKKWSIPRRSQRKMQENCHLRLLIFKLLFKRFFDLKFATFSFFQKFQKTQILMILAAKFWALP